MRKITFNFGFASRYLLAMILKQDHGYHVTRSGDILILAMGILLELILLAHPVKANTTYLPIISQADQAGGTIPPDHKFGPPIHRPAQVIMADKISVDIAFKPTEIKAMDYINIIPRETTTISNVTPIKMEFGDMRVDVAIVYTYTYHTKTIYQNCVLIKTYVKTVDNRFMTIVATGCYDKLTDNLSVDEQYNDVYNATNQIVDLVNPNPAMFYTWDLTLLNP